MLFMYLMNLWIACVYFHPSIIINININIITHTHTQVCKDILDPVCFFGVSGPFCLFSCVCVCVCVCLYVSMCLCVVCLYVSVLRPAGVHMYLNSGDYPLRAL